MIQLYKQGNKNYNMNGDMILKPIEATIRMELNGLWEVNLVHPFDSKGRWKSISIEDVIKVDLPWGEDLYYIYDLDINDCYNASPDSMKSGLDVLKMKEGRKVAILGTMLQLGAEAKKAHKEVGAYAKDIADLLIVTGDFREDFKEGFEKESIKLYNTKVSLIEDLKNVIQKGDNILVKASRGEKYEEIVRELKNI